MGYEGTAGMGYEGTAGMGYEGGGRDESLEDGAARCCVHVGGRHHADNNNTQSQATLARGPHTLHINHQRKCWLAKIG